MAKMILIEEFHLSLRVRAGLPEVECQAIWRRLRERSFQNELRMAVREVVRGKQELRRVRVSLSR